MPATQAEPMAPEGATWLREISAWRIAVDVEMQIRVDAAVRLRPAAAQGVEIGSVHAVTSSAAYSCCSRCLMRLMRVATLVALRPSIAAISSCP